MLRALLAVLVIVSSILIPQYSYAQTPNQLAIFVQIKVQDSSGNLVSYLEPSRIAISNMVALNHLLDSNSPEFQKSFVTNDRQKFEVVKITDEEVHHQSGTIVSQNSMSSYDGKTEQFVVTADHDGFPVVPGDKVTSYWTVIRPAS